MSCMLFLQHVSNNAQTTIQVNDFRVKIFSWQLASSVILCLPCATLLLPLSEFTMPFSKEATVLAVTVASKYRL
jgi:hypothetical protein